MQLKVNKISVNWKEMPRGIFIQFFGMPKTRKTTEASKWSDKGSDGVLVVDTDLGSDFVDGANVVTVTSLNPPMRAVIKDEKHVLDSKGFPLYEPIPHEERGFTYRSGDKAGQPMPVYSISEVLAALYEASETGTLNYDAVVFDTIDIVNKWIEAEVCKEKNIGAMGEGNFGSDWALAKAKMNKIIELLKSIARKTGLNVIFISHSKQTTIVDEKVQLGPELPKGVGLSIMGSCELIGHVTMDKVKKSPMVSFAGSSEQQFGSRLRPLAGKSIPFNYESFKKELQDYTE